MADRNLGRTTPWGLVALSLISGAVATVLGTVPLAGWLDTVGSNQDSPVLRDVASTVQAMGTRIGLDQPYKRLQQVIRTTEDARF